MQLNFIQVKLCNRIHTRESLGAPNTVKNVAKFYNQEEISNFNTPW